GADSEKVRQEPGRTGPRVGFKCLDGAHVRRHGAPARAQGDAGSIPLEGKLRRRGNRPKQSRNAHSGIQVALDNLFALRPPSEQAEIARVHVLTASGSIRQRWLVPGAHPPANSFDRPAKLAQGPHAPLPVEWESACEGSTRGGAYHNSRSRDK